MDMAEAYKLEFESFTGLVRQRHTKQNTVEKTKERKGKETKQKERSLSKKNKKRSLGEEDEEDGGDSSYLVSTSVFLYGFFCVDNI